MFALPALPYDYDALQPVISDDTLHFHHDKHHATFVKTLNELLAKAGDSETSLEAVIQAAAKADDKTLFNNAAQAWNHSFFWLGMSPRKQAPSGELSAAIDKAFGSLAQLKTAFVTEGAGHFGSGWVWLAARRDGGLVVRSTHDADDTVMHPELSPLLVCDLWEHAYYLDHQNDRKGFLEAWFDALPNWEFAASQFAAASGQGQVWTYPEGSREAAAA